VEVSYALGGHNREVTSAVLQWKAPGGEWTDYDITASIGDVAAHSFSSDIYNRTITDHPVLTEGGGNIGVGKYYNYRFVVTTDDGISVTSDTKSMEILHFYYDPNPAPEGGWTSTNTVAEISTTWADHVTDLDFSDGDQIEIQMDLTNCYYVYKNGNKDVDLGVDNIFAIGSASIDGASNAILWYYPAVENLSSTDPGASRLLIHSGGWTNGKYPLSDLTDLLIVFDGNGFGMNGTRYDNLNVGGWTGGVKATLTSADNLYMGSVEGKHHSRAIYHYIRVIRNREM
nr:hypothetical protein [Bacteroidales bacterium]